MQLIEQDPLIQQLHKRIYQLYVSNEFALAEYGVHTGIAIQETEQHSRRRALLAVEKQTNKAKVLEQHGLEHFKQQIDNKFNDFISKKMASEFEDIDTLFTETMRIEDAIASILDILSVRAASVQRIKLLVKSLSWLCSDIIAFVNKPQYRSRSDVKLLDPVLALNYIGLENLKIIIPAFVMRHWLPQTTEPFNLMKRKLWSESLAIGLASKVLAKQAGLNEFNAYCAGLFSNIGHFAITRSYLSYYDKLLQKKLRDAFEAKDKKLHDILVTLEPSKMFLSNELMQLGASLSMQLVEKLVFERLRLNDVMFDLANTESLSEFQPLSKVVAQAKAFAHYKSLQKNSLITADEAKKLMAYFQLSPAQFSLLQKTDLSNLNVHFTQA